VTVDIHKILEVVRRDLDPQTLAIVEQMIHDGHRLTVIRDAFMEEKDALAVKMIRDLDPMRQMEILPFSSDNLIPPAMSAQITARPQRNLFRPRYLILAKATAMAIDVIDIRVGNRSQFGQSGSVPGEMFAVDAPEAAFHSAPGADEGIVYTLHINARGVERLPLPIDFETVQLSMDLVVVITNISDAPIRFRGAFIGSCRDDSSTAPDQLVANFHYNMSAAAPAVADDD
jgi:hypothetical protein